MVKDIWAMAWGSGEKLPTLFNSTMKGEENELCKSGCENEIKRLEDMELWEEVSLPHGKRAVTSK